jgi:hypothetical protein
MTTLDPVKPRRHMRTKLLCALVASAMVLASCGDTADSPGLETATTETVTASTVPPTTEAGPENASADGCPSEHFEVETVNGYSQVDGIDDPELAVECTEDSFIVRSNGIPAFEFVQITPNAIESQDLTFEFPLVPVSADSPGALMLGAIGVSVTGLSIFGAFEAPRDGYRDPFLDGLLDVCNGHTAPGGLYHFHTLMACVADALTEPGVVLGYAYDGYEIVTPWECSGTDCSGPVEVLSSYEKTGDGIAAFEDWTFTEGFGDLDVCNGKTDTDGVYRYYATQDFPYLPFCYHGETEFSGGEHDGDPPAGP